MGGQIGDHGVITGKNGAMTVSDVQKTKDGKYMHIGVVTEGELSVEDEVTASVDAAYRQALSRQVPTPQTTTSASTSPTSRR